MADNLAALMAHRVIDPGWVAVSEYATGWIYLQSFMQFWFFLFSGLPIIMYGYDRSAVEDLQSWAL